MSVCLHHLIERQVRRLPDHPAVAYEHATLTYRELDRRAALLAKELRALGVGPDVLVGLLTERSLDMIVGILGILKAGGAYVPIDAAYPQERIAFMLEDANVKALVAQTHLLARLPGAVASAVCIDALDWPRTERVSECEPSVDETNLAYVIYTSGSTGRPKGVCIEHRNIVQYVQGVAEALRLEPGMSYATVSTIAADLGNTVIFPALATGGCLHVISQERAESGALLADYFSRERIDVLKIVPSHLAALQSGMEPQRLMPRKRLILGGESSRLQWIERLRASAPECTIHNHYGPTETTVGVLTYKVGDPLPQTESGTLPLGKPLPNSRILLLDGGGKPVPVGVQGEIHIGGSGVARGYLGRPELTAAKFIADPTNAGARGRLYRTGDLARVLPDGNLEFCGRADNQIKIRGYRVELEEIENVLCEQPGVQAAAVLAYDDASSEEKPLVAYVVPARASQPLWDVRSLHILPDGSPVAHLNRSETDYMYNEIFVLQAYLRHGIAIRDGDCIVDAGANIGLFTVFANRLGRGLRTFCFEPNPAAFACLEANAAAWGNAVKCLPFGLSRERKSAELTFFKGMSLLSGFYADAATERGVVERYVLNQQADTASGLGGAELTELIEDRMESMPVSAQLRTLSEVIAEEHIERIDLLKINVEKSELDLLLGIDDHDWPRIRQLVIEVDRQIDLEPITLLLARHGYETLVEQDPLLRNTELCYVYAVRRAEAGLRLQKQQPASAHVRSLTAYDGQVLTRPTMRRALKERLSDYMVPSVFVLLQALPLTANGKIDRKALPEPLRESSAQDSQHIAPRTPTEATLIAIWSELLDVTQMSVDDDVFYLGAHSLLAMKAVIRIREAFNVDLPLRNLFERPTVAGLAEMIDALSWLKEPRARLSSMSDREEIAL